MTSPERVPAGLEKRRIIEIFCDGYNRPELRKSMEEAIKWSSARGYHSFFYEEVFG